MSHGANLPAAHHRARSGRERGPRTRLDASVKFHTGRETSRRDHSMLESAMARSRIGNVLRACRSCAAVRRDAWSAVAASSIAWSSCIIRRRFQEHTVPSADWTTTPTGTISARRPGGVYASRWSNLKQRASPIVGKGPGGPAAGGQGMD